VRWFYCVRVHGMVVSFIRSWVGGFFGGAGQWCDEGVMAVCWFRMMRGGVGVQSTCHQPTPTPPLMHPPRTPPPLKPPPCWMCCSPSGWCCQAPTWRAHPLGWTMNGEWIGVGWGGWGERWGMHEMSALQVGSSPHQRHAALPHAPQRNQTNTPRNRKGRQTAPTGEHKPSSDQTSTTHQEGAAAESP